MWILSVAVLLLALSIPWLVFPIRRVFQQEHVGYIMERNILGFWVSIANLSDRLNRLEVDKKKTQAKLKKLQTQIENEKASLNKKVSVIQDDYRAFLYDWNGKRHWKVLFRKVPVPSFAFIAPVEQKRKEDKRRREVWLLQDCPELPEDLRTTGTKVWRFNPEKFPDSQRQRSKRGKKKEVSQTTTVIHHRE